MFVSRISNILLCSLLSPKKFFSISSIPRCELCETSKFYSEASNKRPKKPITSYFRFLFGILPELKANFPDRSYREIVAIGSNIWKTLEITEKQQYIQSYHNDIDKYKLARLKYQCETEDILKNEEQSHIMTKKEKKKLKSLRTLSGRPKRPMTPFLIFLKNKRGTLPKEQAPNWIDDVLSEFNNLSKDEKAKYQNEAKKLREEYRKKISEWENMLIKNGQTDLLFKRSKFKEKE